ncbi:MAG: hypothetical protein LUG99_06635 [Lachnospiraceae bacterium]|nr:hypothetical protein [Lachnospiraceae bacterium]
MEENKLWEEQAKKLPDEALDQVSGGLTVSPITLTGELTESIAEGEKMNTLWDKLYAHGDYGKQVREVVNSYVKSRELQGTGWDFRVHANHDIEVVAKNECVWVNGTLVCN